MAGDITKAIDQFLHAMAEDDGEVTEIVVSRSTYHQIATALAGSARFFQSPQTAQTVGMQQLTFQGPLGTVHITTNGRSNRHPAAPPGPSSLVPLSSLPSLATITVAEGVVLQRLAAMLGVIRMPGETDEQLRDRLRVHRVMSDPQVPAGLPPNAVIVPIKSAEARMCEAEARGEDSVYIDNVGTMRRCSVCQRLVYGGPTKCLADCKPFGPQLPAFPKKQRDPLF